MDADHKLWNARHQQLNKALAAGDRENGIELFECQHAMVHSSHLSGGRLRSFVDELVEDMTDDEIRKIPPGGEHSVAWILFHLARIEDITMNLLVARKDQLFLRDGWDRKMKVSIRHSANKMDQTTVAELSAAIDIKSLLLYRLAVGRRTRQIVRKLQSSDFKRTVDPEAIQRVLDEGAVTSEAMEILHYWSKKTIAGLLLMPPTRHCILHLNEGMKVKKRIHTSIQR
jgi:hypothetical protein